MALGKFTLREIRSRPGRAILTVLSVVIGVAAVVSVSVATSTTRRAFNEMFAAVNGRASLEVTAEAGSSFDQGVADEIAKVPGVEASVPVVRQTAILYYDPKGSSAAAQPAEAADDNSDSEAKKKNTRRVQVTVLGVDPEKDAAVRDYVLVAGKPITTTDNVVLLDSSFAKALDLMVQDNIRLMTRSGRKKFTVVGLVSPRGGAAAAQGVIYMNLGLAQKRMLSEGEIDSVQIVTREGADLPKIQSEISAVLPKGLAVRSAVAHRSQADETLLSTEQALTFATYFSWVLAAMIVLNTFQMNVVERRRQLAIMRAIGATQSQVMRIVCREGFWMGVVGTILGIAAGLGGARLISRATAEMLQIALPPMQLEWQPLALAAIVGPAISLLGALLPAWRASKLSPLEGMGAILPSDMEAPPWRVAALGLLTVALGGGLLMATLSSRIPINNSVIAALLMLIGFVLLIPVSLAPVTRFTSAVLAPLLRVEGRLAEGQVIRRRGRTTLTVGVLFLALSVGIGLASAIVDNVHDVQNWSHTAIQGDFFVRAMMPDMRTGTACDMPRELGDEIRQVQGITNVQTVRFAKYQFKKEPQELGVIIVAGEFSHEESRTFELVRGSNENIHERMKDGDVLVGTVFAQRAGLDVGSEIPLSTKDGPRTVKVIGTVNDYMAGGLTMYLDKEKAQQWLGITGADAYIVHASKGSLDSVAQSLQSLSAKYGVLFQTRGELQGMIHSKTNAAVGCLWFVLVLVFVMAAFGVVNTLTMNVIEQTRELGLLRIVAMTRGQVRKMILSQATLLAAIGLVPGMLSGLGVAYVINLSARPVLGHPIDFVFHPLLILACFAVAFVIMLLAAWFPALRASRLCVVEALQYQ